jgi:hypothetical protein
MRLVFFKPLIIRLYPILAQNCQINLNERNVAFTSYNCRKFVARKVNGDGVRAFRSTATLFNEDFRGKRWDITVQYMLSKW